MSDKIIRCLAYNGKINIKCVSSTELVEKARKIHDLSPVVTAAFGRLLTMSVIMGSNLKEENDAITVQIKSNGPIGTLNSVVDSNLHIKGYVQNGNVDLPLKTDGKLDVGTAVGKNGMLYIIKDIGLKEPYIGLTPLISGEIAEDFAEYYAKSEQTPAAIALGVLVNKDGVKSAGGYMITLMPDATDEDISRLEENLKNVKPISQLLDEEKDLIKIAKIVAGDENIQMLDDGKEPKYVCDCNKARIEKGLISLGKDEIQDIIDNDGSAQIKCKFCKREYNFNENDLKKLKEECNL